MRLHCVVSGGHTVAREAQAIGDAQHEVADPLQFGDKPEGGEQSPRACLAYPGDGMRQLLIDVALEVIEFLLALPHGM